MTHTKTAMPAKYAALGLTIEWCMVTKTGGFSVCSPQLTSALLRCRSRAKWKTLPFRDYRFAFGRWHVV